MMGDFTKTCQTCLSIDRQLIHASRLRAILKQIKLEELVNKIICWECHSVIIKFYRFKVKVKTAENAIKEKLDDFKPLTKLLHTTKHNYDYEFIYNYDPLVNVPAVINRKPEQKLMKQEIFIEETEEIPTLDYSSDDDKKLQDYVDSIKKNTKDKLNIPKKKRSLKQNRKKIKEIESVEVKKFKTVVYTEEEMLRSREEKRSQPNYKKIPFKCDTCVLGFLRKDYYDLHIKKKHDEAIGVHICKICSTRFTSMPPLERHQTKHYLYYSCTLCTYKTSGMKAAMNHCRDKHKHDERDRIHCKQCTAVFRTPVELTDHTRTAHTLCCNLCGEKFKGKHTLRSHKVRIHAVKREFTCDICSRSFLTKSRLESHTARHSGALALRLAYCTQCRIQYKDIHVYRNHVRNSRNHASDRYQCPVCNKKFASKVYWSKHYNFYHLKKSQYKCESCNKLFISKWRLNYHKQLYHGLTRSRDHACNVCGKKFYTLSTLRGHQLTHSEQRQYMCEDCGDTFKQRPALYTHTRLVHKARKCDKKLP